MSRAAAVGVRSRFSSPSQMLVRGGHMACRTAGDGPTELLAPPVDPEAAAGTDPAAKSFGRTAAEYRPRYQRFVLKKRRYNQQFSHMYVSRRRQLSRAVTTAARRQWGDGTRLWRGCAFAGTRRADMRHLCAQLRA